MRNCKRYRRSRTSVPAMALLAVGVLGCAAPAATLVVDNVDAGFSVLPGDAWDTAGLPDFTGQWGDDYRWKVTDDPTGMVEWRPNLPSAGPYEVSVWYRSTGNGRPNNAAYTVHHANGSNVVPVNQQISGSEWVVLGTYDFDAGSAGYVTLTSDAQSNKIIVADAVRFQTPGEPPPPAFRGFWADAFHDGFKSTSEIDSIVARAAAGNYNAIVAEVLAYQDTTGSGHGAYWNSSIVPKALDIVGGIDPLAYLVQQAHAAGIEVHAWLVTYRVCNAWPPSGNSILAAHPEWIMVTNLDMGGGPAPVGGHYTLDPGSPDVQEYLVSIVRELVTNYDIDGINWDYIRYIQTDAGYPADVNYGNSGLQRFWRITGYGSTPSPGGVPEWNDFRRRTIDELVRRCRAEIAAVDSNPRQPLCHSADLICFGDAPIDFTDASAYVLHQDWRKWMEMGWLDAGMPMNYKRESSGSQAAWYRNWVDAAIDWRYDRHMYCGQANYLNSKSDSVTQLQYVFSRGAEGTMNYSYFATADDDLDGNWENDWTWYSHVSSAFFTEPAPTPHMPWRDPQLATEGTVWGRITDYQTGLAIDNATVQVGSLPSVKTDGNGYYVVTLVPAVETGTYYDITVSAWGYPTLTWSSAPVMAGGLTRRDISLGAQWSSGDMDEDGDIDLTDLGLFRGCLRGPGVVYADGHLCVNGDADSDFDIDLGDFASFQGVFGSTREMPGG